MPQTSVAASPTTASRPQTSPPFLCLCEAGSRAAWVHVAGELDLATSPELDEVLQGAQDSARLVVLDLRALTFIDSSAVHVILHAACRRRQTGGELLLVRGPSQVDLVFTLTGASDKVSIFDVDAAELGSSAASSARRVLARARSGNPNERGSHEPTSAPHSRPGHSQHRRRRIHKPAALSPTHRGAAAVRLPRAAKHRLDD